MGHLLIRFVGAPLNVFFSGLLENQLNGIPGH